MLEIFVLLIFTAGMASNRRFRRAFWRLVSEFDKVRKDLVQRLYKSR